MAELVETNARAIEPAILSKAQHLRAHLSGLPLVRVMGVHDGLSARLAERAGFDAVWASGLGISASHGVPDNSVLTMTEFLASADVINSATTLPVVADCDTGFGDVNAVMRMVRSFEGRGIAGVCIEDKEFPKRNSFRDGHRLADVCEFAAKVNAAVAVRNDPAFMVIARLESLIAGRGLDDALERGMEYAAAGADAILVHSKAPSPTEVLAFAARWRACRGDVPLVVVPTTYYSATDVQLREARVAMVIYANQALRGAVSAMEATMVQIARLGTSRECEGDIAPVERVFELTGTAEHEEREAHYQRLVRQMRGAGFRADSFVGRTGPLTELPEADERRAQSRRGPAR